MGMNAVRRYFASFEMILAGVLLVAMTLLLAVQIVERYILGSSIVWLEEIARICFVWLIYFSAAGATRDDRHIRIEILDLFLGPAALKWVTLFADVLTIGFDLVIVWLGILLVKSSIQYGDVTPVTNIPMGFIYVVIPVCYGLMAYRLFDFNIRKRAGLVEPAVYDSFE
jgi:TRAP-type C4-dicarboxylate transport system permease small subunit